MAITDGYEVLAIKNLPTKSTVGVQPHNMVYHMGENSPVKVDKTAVRNGGNVESHSKKWSKLPAKIQKANVSYLSQMA